MWDHFFSFPLGSYSATILVSFVGCGFNIRTISIFQSMELMQFINADALSTLKKWFTNKSLLSMSYGFSSYFLSQMQGYPKKILITWGKCCAVYINFSIWLHLNYCSYALDIAFSGHFVSPISWIFFCPCGLGESYFTAMVLSIWLLWII